MNSVTVNGISINVPNGSSISVINNQVYIDGVLSKGGEPVNNILKIEVHGDITLNQCDGNLHVLGNIRGPVSVDGNLQCSGQINGDVRADGNVICGKISGFVKAGGNIISKG